MVKTVFYIHVQPTNQEQRVKDIPEDSYKTTYIRSRGEFPYLPRTAQFHPMSVLGIGVQFHEIMSCTCHLFTYFRLIYD